GPLPSGLDMRMAQANRLELGAFESRAEVSQRIRTEQGQLVPRHDPVPELFELERFVEAPGGGEHTHGLTEDAHVSASARSPGTDDLARHQIGKQRLAESVPLRDTVDRVRGVDLTVAPTVAQVVEE